MPQAQTTRLVAAISSQLFICVYASMYFFLKRAFVLTTFTAMTARDDAGRFALLTNVDCDTLSVPGPRLQWPGQSQRQVIDGNGGSVAPTQSFSLAAVNDSRRFA